jgi:hypothetical protein
MQAHPPAQAVAEILSRNDFLSKSIKANGICKKVDSSMFEEALKESDS